MQTIAESWDEIAVQVRAAGMSENGLRGLRNAYYMGFSQMMKNNAAISRGLKSGELSGEEVGAIFDGFNGELRQMATDLREKNHPGEPRP